MAKAKKREGSSQDQFRQALAERHRGKEVFVARRDGPDGVYVFEREQDAHTFAATLGDGSVSPEPVHPDLESYREQIKAETGFDPATNEERAREWPACPQCGGAAYHEPNCAWLGCFELEARMYEAISTAQDAFWAAVADAFPETTSGDYAPGGFEDEAPAAVAQWVHNNVTPALAETVEVPRRLAVEAADLLQTPPDDWRTPNVKGIGRELGRAIDDHDAAR